MAVEFTEQAEETQSRQSTINNMEVGESVSIAHRMDLTFGIEKDAVSSMSTLLRGNLDQQANRARKRTGREYVVENGSYLTKAGALVVCCTVTRLR